MLPVEVYIIRLPFKHSPLNMKSTIKLLGLLALLATAAPTVGFSADKAADKTKTETAPAKEAAKPKFIPLYGEVDSITDKLLTIKSKKGDRKFVITPETKVTKDKAPAKTSDVKIGQWIGGSYLKNADGTNTLHSLNLSVKQKDEKAETAAAATTATTTTTPPATATPEAKTDTKKKKKTTTTDATAPKTNS